MNQNVIESNSSSINPRLSQFYSSSISRPPPSPWYVILPHTLCSTHSSALPACLPNLVHGPLSFLLSVFLLMLSPAGHPGVVNRVLLLIIRSTVIIPPSCFLLINESSPNIEVDELISQAAVISISGAGLRASGSRTHTGGCSCFRNIQI